METGSKWKMVESIPRAVFVVVSKGDVILFVRHGEGSANPAGTYGFPGGKTEPHEDPKQTAVRELFEETGIIALPADLSQLGTHSIEIETKNGMEPWTVELYLCRQFEGQIRQREKSEAPVWLRIANVLDGRYQMPRMSREYLFSNNENSARPVRLLVIDIQDRVLRSTPPQLRHTLLLLLGYLGTPRNQTPKSVPVFWRKRDHGSGFTASRKMVTPASSLKIRASSFCSLQMYSLLSRRNS